MTRYMLSAALKSNLRSSYIERRNCLSDELMQAFSKGIFHHFSQLDFTGVRKILSYKSILSKKEFDPEICSRWLIDSNPGIVAAWPRTFNADNRMEAVEISENEFFSENKWGILEPVGGRVIHPQELDMVLVPLLCFDLKGFRVGYGKGFYDRFFARCRKDVKKIGFSFFEPIVKIEDIDQFDVPLDHCITPSGIYEF